MTLDETSSADVLLPLGSSILRKEIHDRWGGVRQGGVSPSDDTPNIFLFTDPKANRAHGYVPDRWVAADLFEYCGEGQRGHQTVKRYNKSVAQSRTYGKTLQLFRGWKGTVEYVGPFALDDREPYFYKMSKDVDGNDRRAIVFRLRPLGFTGVPDSGQPAVELEEPVKGGPLQGRKYFEADETVETAADRVPFSVDPDVQDRSLQAHATAQNLLAAWVRRYGLEPLSPGPGDPSFDLAWRLEGAEYVAEVKSLLPQNEVRQLRLGLGQLLDYRQHLGAEGVLFVDRRPSSDRWLQICERAGVRLWWPALLDEGRISRDLGLRE